MKLLIIQNFSKSCLFTFGVTNFETSPPNRTISFTSFDAIAWCLASAIKKTVSMLLFNTRFIPTIWNSYSKSATARSPLKITEAFTSFAQSTRRFSNG